ncbi:Low-density lipoprotein receptor-related protein 1, partial [Geodia barretti]
MSFGEQFPVYSPELFPGTTATVHFGYLVAPYWVDGDLRRGGNITWEILTSGGSEIADQYLGQVSQFIEVQQNATFVGNWMLMVNYMRVPPFLSSFPTNTFQAVLITNGTNSYAVFTYECPEVQWGNYATIGFNAGGTYFENHEFSGSTDAPTIDCIAEPELVSNLVYDLVPSPGDVQCTTSTPEPPSSLETCRGSGYETCCASTCASTTIECFCDPTCHFFGDCCRDIDELCPMGDFTWCVGETYLLFANSYHINRVSVNGSSFEILYSEQFSGGIVALDYDYRDDMMYWSNINQGALSRAYLNGSNPELLYNTSDPSIYDLAVDWVNGKLYWTEDTRGEVLVLDLQTRLKRTLIANYDTATTRAIVVDPTTKYMYWTDWGDEARIERAGMDGTNRSILHNTNLVWPNGLTLDIPGQKIYWIDASLDTIEFSFTDGSGRTLLDRQDDVIFHPFSLTFADDFLFWSDWVQLTIFTTHRDRPNDNIVQLDLFTPLIYPPHGIEAVTPDRQPQVENPCDSASCNSSSMCLLSPTSPDGYTCVCADDVPDCIGEISEISYLEVFIKLLVTRTALKRL